MKKTLSIILCLALVFAIAGCSSSTEPKAIALEEAKELLADAYIFTLPLMMTDATYVKATNTVKTTDKQAPENQFIHTKNLATANFKDVVTPNVDTVYSQIFLQLEKDAVILEFPKTERFCTVQIIDAYTNCIDILDATEFENDTEKFIFTSSSFSGEIPEGMTEIKSPTNLVWIIVRTICHSPEDLENVHEIQSKMDSYTLTQYKNGTTNEKPDGTFDENNNFIPSQHVLSLSMQEYFDKANILLSKNPPFEADTEMVERIAKINVGAGLNFDSSIFGESADEIWKELSAGITKRVTEGSAQFMTKNGCWSYMGAPIAEFGTEYDYRALIAIMGLGANPVSVAVYPKTDIDSEGNPLNGENKYVLHIEKDEFPPTEELGFWSITIYDQDNFLIDNEINRYCINDRSDLKFNEDGSLDIYIQSEKPEENLSNWLPTCEGDFHLVLRVYLPEESVKNNTWKAPIINKQ